MSEWGHGFFVGGGFGVVWGIMVTAILWVSLTAKGETKDSSPQIPPVKSNPANSVTIFGPSTVSLGTNKVDQPLKAYSVTITEVDKRVRNRMVIKLDSEEFVMYFEKMQDAQRFMDRAIDFRFAQTITGGFVGPERTDIGIIKP